MINILKITVLFSLLQISSLLAQTSQVDGLRENTPTVFAFTNAEIFVSSGHIIHGGDLIIRDGVIEEIGDDLSIPGDAWVVDLDGKTVYPGFIELYSGIGLTDDKNDEDQASRYPADEEGAYHWNPQIRPWYNAAGHFRYNEKEISALRSKGFTKAHIIPHKGILKGQTAVVSLGEGSNNDLVNISNIAQALSFSKSEELGGDYPTSLMGVIALIRQAFHDSRWYLEAKNAYHENPSEIKQPGENLALAALIEAAVEQQPVIVPVDDEHAFFRAKMIADEFDLQMWIKGNGYEYRRLDEIQNCDIPLIIPLNFPEKPDVKSFDKAINISLESLMHWELASYNPARLYDAGVEMMITSNGIDSANEFLEQLRLAVKRGLPEYAALDALTINPARLLQIDDTHGTLEKGKKADLIITDGSIFKEKTKIEEVWVDGEKYRVDKPYELNAGGKWKLIIEDNDNYLLDLEGDVGAYKGKIKIEDEEFDIKNAVFDKQRINFMVSDLYSAEDTTVGITRMSAQVSEMVMYGIGEKPTGDVFNWIATRIAEDLNNKDEELDNNGGNNSEGDNNLEIEEVISKVLLPPMEYGLVEIPEQAGCLLIKNATLWTQSEQGIIEGGDMLIEDGNIVNVGKGIEVNSNCSIMDVSGKHVTPGLIDPHLHTSITGGVNEVGHAITAETRIKDVIDSDNIWIYRLLAGGLTTANLLHGSANPIGGQDAVIKMRWGSLPGDLLFEGAKPGLKLALGENVKRRPNRYPNTRMGTEQIIRDSFHAALDYKTEKDAMQSKGLPYRKDLQLEALLEVLEGKRIVHAHAYRQDEMQMLMRLAEDFDFKITSFEHTVEGYKIADLLREHGAAAIVWTDWGSFKIEAYDATIYNARLLTDQGVLTSLHSDNTLLATRMHWEAGKVAGTGIDDINAMNMITINPAKILGVDSMVGSLEEGKHADFVIWSDHPLRGFAHANQTWVDGRKYFDREKDRKITKQILTQKHLLINKVLDDNDNNNNDNDNNNDNKDEDN